MRKPALVVDLVARRTRSGARLLGLMAAGLFFLVLAMESAEPEGLAQYSSTLFAFCAVPLLGVAVAWQRERVGALLMKVGAGASGVFALVSASRYDLGESDLLAFSQVYVIIVLAAGLLFLISDQRASLAE